MMNKLTKKQMAKINKLGWNISDCGAFYELENYSPAGEDLCVTLMKDEDLKQQAIDNYDDFDTEGHIEMWIEAKKNGVAGVPSARELVEDADEIEKMFEDLAMVFGG